MDLLYLIVSWTLVGFIWLVQLCHYPAFRFVKEEEWKSFHSLHTRNISFIAIPLMLMDLSLGIYFTIFSFGWIHTLCLLLVFALWLNTFLIAVPLHTILGERRDPKTIENLIKVNWWRTGMWTLKALLLLLAWYVYK